MVLREEELANEVLRLKDLCDFQIERVKKYAEFNLNLALDNTERCEESAALRKENARLRGNLDAALEKIAEMEVKDD